mgnify:CR=1 FL=1|tara:strand:+ start:12462 stop:14516 length:2055 start_codon:yes stop_codon:yes gene_type:complete
MKQLLKNSIKYLISFYILFYINNVYALSSNWEGLEEAKVRLISPLTNSSNSNSLHLGLQYNMKKGWKTYWHSPGDGGFAQSIYWQKSKNISNVELMWPTPVEFEILGIKSLGYKKEVVFPLKIDLIDPNKESELFLAVEYLACEKICLPGEAELKIIIPPGKGNLTEFSFLIEKYISKVPLKNSDISEVQIEEFNVFNDINDSSISIKAINKKTFHNPILFIGNDIDLPVVDNQINISANGKNLNALFKFENFKFDSSKKLNLVLVIQDQNHNIQFNKKNLKIKNQINNNKLNSIYIIAIIGGFILNLMPCVFPVLSIKLISILNVSNNDTLSTRISFLTNAFGIIISFIGLGLILILLKFSGYAVGWGMQFQQPIFLMFIIVVLFLFAINLLDLFHINAPILLTNLLIKLNFKNKYLKDFFNGFFATLLATPCSAPFVGTAITAAFSLHWLQTIGIFFFMGIGMSLPYLLISTFPKLILFLPKTGKWTKIFKYFLSLLLFGTIFWVGTILLNHFNYIFIVIILILALIIILLIKFLEKSKFLYVSFVIILYFFLVNFEILKSNNTYNSYDWQNLEIQNIQELINDDEIIFVDITADWCATCKFNKYNVIDSKEIKRLFLENNVIKIKGDWTKPNQEVKNYLNLFNRYAIPFNVIYSKKFPKGVVLSEILSKNEIINLIENSKD